MIADKILRSEISRFKILSANFKIQPQRLKFSRAPVIWLRPHFKFYRLPQNLARKTGAPQSRLRRNANAPYVLSFRSGANSVLQSQEPARRWIKSAPQSNSAPQLGLQRSCAQSPLHKNYAPARGRRQGAFMPKSVKNPHHAAKVRFKTKNPPSRRATYSHRPP